MNNNDKPTRGGQGRYYRIAQWAAERGLHADACTGAATRSVDQLLTIFERVNQRGADRAAALVDRASQRRLGADACGA